MILTASFLVCAATLHIAGPLYFGDAPQYLAGAYGLANFGRLLDVNGNPMVHWAPLLSVLYFPIYAWGFPIYDWARWINILALAVYLVSTYAIIQRLIRDRLISAFIVGGHIFWQPIFAMFNFIQTESIALALLSIAIYCLISIVQKFDARYFTLLIIVSFFSALLRYAALFTIGSMAVVLLFFLPFTFRKRLMLSALYGMTSLSGLGAWLLRNRLVSGDLVERTFYAHPVDFSSIVQDMLRLFVAVSATNYFTIGCIVLLTIVGFTLYRSYVSRKDGPPEERHVYGILLWLSISYVLLLETTQYLFDQVTMLTTRLVSPALFSLFLAGAVALYYFFRVKARTRAVPWIAGCMLVLGLIEAADSLESLTGTIVENRRQSTELTLLRQLDLTRYGMPLYGNNDELLFFVVQRFVQSTPHRLDRYHLTPNPNYMVEIEEMQRQLKNEGAIVYFGSPLYEQYHMPIEAIRALPSLQAVYSGQVVVFQDMTVGEEPTRDTIRE